MINLLPLGHYVHMPKVPMQNHLGANPAVGLAVL
jgi:hypothetical protein